MMIKTNKNLSPQKTQAYTNQKTKNLRKYLYKMVRNISRTYR